jgi:hypothetical protein
MYVGGRRRMRQACGSVISRRSAFELRHGTHDRHALARVALELPLDRLALLRAVQMSTNPTTSVANARARNSHRRGHATEARLAALEAGVRR